MITARGGSKGIPRKNLAIVAGRPLISWTISCALQASTVDKVIVSTDDPEIATVARADGAEVPLLRPTELAGDEIGHLAVMQHVVDILDPSDMPGDWIVLLQPTSPLRLPLDIDRAIALASGSAADSVVSVSKARTHPRNIVRLSADGLVERAAPGDWVARRQNLDAVYEFNGAIYCLRPSRIRAGDLFGSRILAYEMPAERSLDIDEPWDLIVADALLREEKA